MTDRRKDELFATIATIMSLVHAGLPSLGLRSLCTFPHAFLSFVASPLSLVQFTEVQQLALFARYDESCTGDVDYTEFVNTLMESDFKGVANSAHGGRLHNMIQRTFSVSADNAGMLDEEAKMAAGEESDEDSDLDEEEKDQFRRMEVLKIFQMLDQNNSGDLDKREVNLMMMALGKTISRFDMDKGWAKVDCNNSGAIDFEEFYAWYQSMDT